MTETQLGWKRLEQSLIYHYHKFFISDIAGCSPVVLLLVTAKQNFDSSIYWNALFKLVHLYLEGNGI
jgi:hypothetical protein